MVRGENVVITKIASLHVHVHDDAACLVLCVYELMLSTMCIQSVFEKIITSDSNKHFRFIHKISSVNNEKHHHHHHHRHRVHQAQFTFSGCQAYCSMDHQSVHITLTLRFSLHLFCAFFRFRRSFRE